MSRDAFVENRRPGRGEGHVRDSTHMFILPPMPIVPNQDLPRNARGQSSPVMWIECVVPVRCPVVEGVKYTGKDVGRVSSYLRCALGFASSLVE